MGGSPLRPARRAAGPYALLAIVFALFLQGLAPAARAQDAGKAQTYLMEGEAASRDGRHEEALAAFEKAHALAPSGATAIRIAGALFDLKRYPEAFDAYERALAEHESTLFGADKTKAKDRLKELEGLTGLLTITVNEADAQIRIDDVVAGPSPLSKKRLARGKHVVKVTKSGFAPVQVEVDLAGAEAATTVTLEAVKIFGRLTIEVKDAAPDLRLVIDGEDVGPPPYDAEIAPGSHDVAARSDSQVVDQQTIEVKKGETSRLELTAKARPGKVEVRIKDEAGDIYIDGEKVGSGRFQGDVAVGEHELSVKREGYEPFTKTIRVTATEVVVETVSLRKSTAGDDVAESEEGDWTFDGLYGGISLTAAFLPRGTGNTLEDSCDATGATSCDAGFPVGGTLNGYIGYAFAPLGFELYLRTGGDVVSPKGSFDGVTGSDINPLVAAPARDEAFTIGRVGGGGAIRLRVLVPIDRFRITGALGAGLAYRHLLMARDTTAVDGGTNKFTADAGYVTPVLSFDVGGQVRLVGTTALTLGFDLWLENAGSSVRSEPETDQLLTGGPLPAPIATPAYDLANGAQLYVGPYLGLHFGP
ncbi:MAG: PEGA domain-containing protein [Polyangiaceae bacterium]